MATKLKKKMSNEPETYTEYRARIKVALTDAHIDDVDPPPLVHSKAIQIPPVDDDGVERWSIAWLLFENAHKMFYVKTVPPGKHIQQHSHPEPVFRYIISGKLKLKVANETNFLDIKEGEWFHIKENTPYEIKADPVKGYKALAAYRFSCSVAK